MSKIENNVKYVINADNFFKIPGTPIAYWICLTLFDAFTHFKSIGEYCDVRNGLTTGDNNRFLRLWFEVTADSTKWFPCNKGGAFRRWAGNEEYYIDWQNDGESLKHFVDELGRPRATLRGIDMNFTAGITMSRVTSGLPSFREMSDTSISESATNAIYPIDGRRQTALAIMALLNSKIGVYILDILNPTLNIVPENIRGIPAQLLSDADVEMVEENIKVSKRDWDAFETSWDFKRHPLI